MQDAFPDHALYRAWTSKMIIKKLKKRDNVQVFTVTEAMEQMKRDGMTYATATHDEKNPASGRVMEKIGMKYRYSYREQWQPKNIPVIFRMYQINLDGKDDRVYRAYWERYPEHFISERI